MSPRFVPKHFVLHSGRFRLFSRQKVKFKLTCPQEDFDRGLLTIKQHCRQFVKEELAISDGGVVMTKLALQLAQLNVKNASHEESQERIRSILVDTAASLSYSRFLDVVTLIQMEVPGHVLEALAGRFFYSMEVVHAVATKQELLSCLNEFPWIWLLPLYQTAVAEDIAGIVLRHSSK